MLNIFEEIKAHCLKYKDVEVCGLVIQRLDGEFEVVKERQILGKNTAKIFPDTYLLAASKGDIKYAYHSHINESSFSVKDKLVSAAHKIPLILFDNGSQSFSFHGTKDFQFEFGKTDCFHYVIDYYKTIGIHIYDNCPHRTKQDLISNPKYIDERAAELGFKEILVPQKNDVVSYYQNKTKKIPSHLGIYLSDINVVSFTKNGLVSREYKEIKPLIHKIWRKK